MPFPVAFFARSVEAIPIDDHCVNTVVTTFTLCTIADPLAALREMRRVLRPTGRLLFAEHGLAPDRSVQRWQHRCNPVWKRIAGGCNLDRKMDGLIGTAGFHIAELTVEYAKGARPLGYIYAGSARPKRPNYRSMPQRAGDQAGEQQPLCCIGGHFTEP